MACETFDPTCPYCRPILINQETKQVYPPDDPVMQVVNRVFDEAPRAQQEAFFRVTVKNSRDPEDLALLTELSEHIQVALKGH